MGRALSESFDTPPTAAETQAAGFDTPPTAAELGPQEPAQPNIRLVPPPPTADPNFSAFQATQAGLSSGDAAQALAHSDRTGFAPEFVAGNLPAIKAQADRDRIAETLAKAPGVASYAAQSAVHASVVKDDLPALSRLEWALTGKWEMYPAPADVRAPTGEIVTPKGSPMVRLVTPPFWAREFAAGLAQQKTAALQFKAGTVGLSPEEEAALTARETAPSQDFGEEGRASKLIGEVSRQLPGLLELGAGAALGGVTAPIVTRGKVSMEAGAKAGAGIVMFAQSYGPLYRRLAALPADDGVSPLLSDNEAKALAAVGAGATSYAASTVGLPFLQKLPGIREVFQKIGAEGLATAMARPGVAQALAQAGATYGKNYLHGLAMVGVQAAGERATEEIAKVSKAQSLGEFAGKAVDLYEHTIASAAESVASALGSMAVISAYHPAVETAGAALRARSENAQLREMIAQAKASGLVGREPQVAAQVIDGIGGGTVYVDKQAFDAYHGDAAPQAAGRAYADAEATGGPVAVPIREHLTTGLDAAAKLVDDTRRSPDAQSLNEAREEVKHPEAPPVEGVSPYEVPKPPRVTPDDVAHARAAIESKTIGELDSGYYEAAANKAAKNALRLAIEPDTKGEAILTKYAEALNVSLDTVRNAVQGTFAADTLPEVRRKIRGAETEANRLEAGRLETLRNLEEQHATLRQERQAQLDQYQRQQANALALHQADQDVAGEMDKLRDRMLAKAGNTEYLAKLGKAGFEYRDAHDALFSSVFGGQPEPGALEPLLGRMEREGQLIGFDENEIRGLLADPLKWEEMTPAQARNFGDAVTDIRKNAERLNQIARADRLQSLREFVAQVGDDASTRKDVGAPSLTRSAESTGKRLMRKAGAINAANLKPETIFSMLGETAQRFYEESLIKARDYKAELQGEFLRYFQEHFDKQMRSLRRELARPVQTSLTVPKEVDLDGSRMNQETLAMAFLNLGTYSNEQRLLGGYQWQKSAVIDAIGQNLKPETVRLLQGILSYNDEKLWPLISAHAEKATGIAPPKIPGQPITIHFADGTVETFEGGYFPAAPHPDALTVPSRGGDGVQNLDRYAQATVQAAFTKLRADQASYPIDLNWSRYPAHISSVMHYLAYDEPVRDIQRLLRDDEFRGIVRHRVGDQYLDQLDDDLRIWARGNANDARGSTNAVSRFFSGFLRTRAVSNALAFSTPIALGQESHIQYAITSGEISLKNGTAAAARALIPENWQAANETFSELRFRSDHYAAQYREALSGTQAKSDIMRGLDVLAFAQMDIADRVLSHVIIDAAYNDGLGQDLTHDEAVNYANRKLRLLMPTHNVLEMAPIVRDRGVIGALMLFRGLPNVVWNVEAGLFDEAQQQMAAAIGPKMLAAAGGRYALNGARAVASMATLHMLGRVLMGHGKKDEDGPGAAGWATWAERETISSQFARAPLGRDIAEPFVDAYFHDKTADEAIRELASGRHMQADVAVIYGILRDIGTVVSDSKETADRMQAGINTLATLAGVGARPLTRAGRYGYDVSQGNRSPRGPFDAAGGFVYGERDRQDKNPGTAIQDLISGE